MGWILLAVVVAALAAVPVWLNSRRIPVERRDWPGSYIDLPQGTTRYRWIGGVRGPVIVSVHGLTTPSEVWEPVARRLTEIGYRVLIYDLYGRGGSANAGGVHDTAFHVRQLRDLLAALNLTDELILMGYSMGGQIAAAFAAEAPERVQRVVLVAPAGLGMNESRLERFCRKTPLLGDWAQVVLGGQALARVADASEAMGGEGSAIADIQRRQLSRRGYLQAVLNSRRSTLDRSREDIYRDLGRTGLPVISLWGAADEVIPLTAMGRLTQEIRNARQETVRGAGHGLPFTHPDEVAGHLKSMLLEGR